METTERIVEAYARYVKRCATIPNIRCGGQLEIDLLAINPLTGERFHIESGVSISGPFSQLTDKPFSPNALKTRVQTPGQRRTIGYFRDRKFTGPGIIDTLADYGFVDGNYSKVIVSWGWTQGAQAQAAAARIVLWDFRDIIQEIAEKHRGITSYFTDDTLRTLQLFDLATIAPRRQSANQAITADPIAE